MKKSQKEKYVEAIKNLERQSKYTNARFMKVLLRLWETESLKDADIARRTKISPSVISDIRNGRKPPTDQVLQRMAKEFSAAIEYINTGEGGMFKEVAPPAGEIQASERALLDVMCDHLIKLEAKVYGKPLQLCMDEIGADTILKLKSARVG